MAIAGERDVGEAGRIGELYQRHAPGAVRLAYLITGDGMLAEDLAHEAFVRLLGRFRDLRNPRAFPWYLRRTVVNWPGRISPDAGGAGIRRRQGHRRGNPVAM
jgi:DNA-directed RNA polymerase specialized sigma24 family protein